MARSRLEKIGTIFSRTSGLLKAGAIKEEDKPLWYAIYQAFPPKDEPRYDRPASQLPIRDIFYPEDAIRAKFHTDHPNQPSVNLKDWRNLSQTQKFIAAYRNLEQDDLTPTERYEAAAQQLQSDIETMKKERSQQTPVAQPEPTTSRTKPEKINLDLANIFKND